MTTIASKSTPTKEQAMPPCFSNRLRITIANYSHSSDTDKELLATLTSSLETGFFLRTIAPFDGCLNAETLNVELAQELWSISSDISRCKMKLIDAEQGTIDVDFKSPYMPPHNAFKNCISRGDVWSRISFRNLFIDPCKEFAGATTISNSDISIFNTKLVSTLDAKFLDSVPVDLGIFISDKLSPKDK